MKFSILIDMLFDLLFKRKITAAYLAEKYQISPRTVYRYVDLLSQKLPITVKRGRNGGIYLSDSYRLPVGFMSADEYTAAINALVSAYANDPKPCFLEAKRKLSAQLKREQKILAVTGEAGSFFIENIFPAFTEKIRILEECIRNGFLAEITYLPERNNGLISNVEPHALLLHKGIWLLYAFCHTERAFRLFSLSKISTVLQTDTPFRKRPFEWSDALDLCPREKQIIVRLAVAEHAVPTLRERLGVEAFHKTKDRWFAELLLPDSEATVYTVLSLGENVEILSPIHLREKVRTAVQILAKKYK